MLYKVMNIFSFLFILSLGWALLHAAKREKAPTRIAHCPPGYTETQVGDGWTCKQRRDVHQPSWIPIPQLNPGHPLHPLHLHLR